LQFEIPQFFFAEKKLIHQNLILEVITYIAVYIEKKLVLNQDKYSHIRAKSIIILGIFY